MFFKMFSESSTGHWAVLQLPCCPSKQQELSKDITKPSEQVAAPGCRFGHQINILDVIEQTTGSIDGLTGCCHDDEGGRCDDDKDADEDGKAPLAAADIAATQGDDLGPHRHLTTHHPLITHSPANHTSHSALITRFAEMASEAARAASERSRPSPFPAAATAVTPVPHRGLAIVLQQPLCRPPIR